jgi:negative regulator of flagellin synthesis FlgM
MPEKAAVRPAETLMKIGSSLDLHATEASHRTERGGAAQRTGAAGKTSSVEQVDVSSAAAQLQAGGMDFDAAKVDAIRSAIREGRFTVNAGAIADQLIADAAALLGPRQA